jgi:16S rRNA (uracil1498-N3)-methyltransferase
MPDHPAGHPADHPGPLVFVDDVEAPQLGPEDRHHLERVLRLRSGAPITVGDGRGRFRPARLGPAVEPTGPVVDVPAAVPALTVGFALSKGDKPELVVQKLTELGIDRIVPFRAARSVVRWDDAKAAKAVERLRLVARSAAAQCHRPWLPQVAEVASLADLLAEPGVAVVDRGGGPLPAGTPTLLVGPEGGWEPGEVPAGVTRVGLGAHVLRAETAAIAAGVRLTADRA